MEEILKEVRQLEQENNKFKSLTKPKAEQQISVDLEKVVINNERVEQRKTEKSKHLNNCVMLVNKMYEQLVNLERGLSQRMESQHGVTFNMYYVDTTVRCDRIENERDLRNFLQKINGLFSKFFFCYTQTVIVRQRSSNRLTTLNFQESEKMISDAVQDVEEIMIKNKKSVVEFEKLIKTVK